jgi:hypothetical protein
LDYGNSIATEWVILMLLSEHQQAVELIRLHEVNMVPYQFASWLVYHQFDPGPFPSLIQMLERENVQRPPAAEIPFACPPI